MTRDASNGWDDIASEFMALRSDIGSDVIRGWMNTLPAQGSVLDLGCGFGFPVTGLLYDNDFDVCGIEPSPRLVQTFRQRLPNVPVACETVESSTFFHRTFDGVCAIGLIFLLPPSSQLTLFQKVSNALNPTAQFLFSAPTKIHAWQDSLTHRRSVSLGVDAYVSAGAKAGLSLQEMLMDAGGNNYYIMRKLSV